MNWKTYISQLKKQDTSWLPDVFQEAIRFWVNIQSIDAFWQWTLEHPTITAGVFDLLGYPDLDNFFSPAKIDLSSFEDTLWYRRCDLDGIPFIDQFTSNDPNTAVILYPNKHSDGIELKAINIPVIQFEAVKNGKQ